VLKQLVPIIGILAITALSNASAEPAPEGCSGHFLGGEMPNVDANRTERTQVICFSKYALLHSGKTKTPVWSAEHLTRARVNRADGLTRPSSSAFHAEQSLSPEDRAELDDYKNSGFDRGHMSPNGDMSTKKAQKESFSLANMVPQAPCNNEVLWAGLESAVRTLAKDDDELFVVTGPVYPSDAQLQQIGNGVIVPPELFKAVFDPKLNQAAAYVSPNQNELEWRTVSIDTLKQLTGVDAFPTLSQEIKATAMALPGPEAPRFNCRVHD
jgi:endonuclease G, mitochondrial